jgi:quinone-modifying oxidoreductase subunit QmoA
MADEKGMTSGSILVVGGGISGLTTALEAAEVGYEVYLVEKNPYLGGRVAQLNKYFPKLCPPSCGLEINFKRIKNNRRIKFYTLSEVEKISGSPGNYDVTVKQNPRYVNANCTACNDCVDACPVERASEFDFGMGKTKAIYRPHEMSFPMKYVIDDSVCKKDECGQCVSACSYNAIDLSMGPKSVDLKVGSVVIATGWKPYDATKLDKLGFGKIKNVITNMMMERLAAPNGPTKGKIQRPSGGNISSVAFAQCAGSRDENHLPYCSYICCMASLKQATYIREQYPDAKIYIFYIDIRSPGDRYEKFYKKVKADKNIFFIKGKVAEIEEGSTGMIVVAENALTGEKMRQEVDMAVLATGMMPTGAETKISGDITYNEEGFVVADLEKGGIFAAGCAKKPADVMASAQNATGTALKAIQTLVRR